MATLESLEDQRKEVYKEEQSGRLALTRSVSPGCSVAELGRTDGPTVMQGGLVSGADSLAVPPHAATTTNAMTRSNDLTLPRRSTR